MSPSPTIPLRDTAAAPPASRRALRIAFLSNANSLHLREWAEYLAGTLHCEVTVLTVPRLARPYGHGVRTVEVGDTWAGRRKVFWPLLLPRIRRELAAVRPDVLVGYRVVSYGFLAALTGVRPLVLAAQGGQLTWPADEPKRRACVRYAVRRADLLNAWAPNIKEQMRRHGADAERIVVLSRGVDLSLFPALPDKSGLPPTIVMTRSLLPSYNTRQLIAALPRVVAAVPDVRCEIAGDGPLRADLEAQAAALGVADHVHFLGRIPRAEVVRRLERAQVYCSTTVSDGLPLSHFEAMAAGAVPVCTDIPANRVWIKDGENGFLAPLGDAARLADRLVRALRDEAFRAAVVPANRSMVERRHDRQRNLPLMTRGWEKLADEWSRHRRSSLARHARCLA